MNDKIVPLLNVVSLYRILNAYNIPNIFIQSVAGYGHELGPNISNRNNLVFVPASDARFPASVPKRYTRKLYPISLEEKLVESIDQFIDLYSR